MSGSGGLFVFDSVGAYSIVQMYPQSHFIDGRLHAWEEIRNAAIQRAFISITCDAPRNVGTHLGDQLLDNAIHRATDHRDKALSSCGGHETSSVASSKPRVNQRSNVFLDIYVHPVLSQSPSEPSMKG
jgi:hypothetical protein